MNSPLYVRRTGSKRYRRIDRYIQLALTGAGRCVGEIDLDPDTGLYVATGKGPASNNIEMQLGIFRDRTAPGPIQFINAVSNSVSFYVMQDHGLHGQNLLISREVHAFEAALDLATNDLLAGRTGQALVGMVDELTHPLEHQCRRLNVSVDTTLGEGSHWFLLSRDQSSETLGVIQFQGLFENSSALISEVKKLRQPHAVFFGANCDHSFRQSCMRVLDTNCSQYQTSESMWDGINAGAMLRYLNQSKVDACNSLLLISRDFDGRCQCTHVNRQNAHS